MIEPTPRPPTFLRLGDDAFGLIVIDSVFGPAATPQGAAYNRSSPMTTPKKRLPPKRAPKLSTHDRVEQLLAEVLELKGPGVLVMGAEDEREGAEMLQQAAAAATAGRRVGDQGVLVQIGGDRPIGAPITLGQVLRMLGDDARADGVVTLREGLGLGNTDNKAPDPVPEIETERSRIAVAAEQSKQLATELVKRLNWVLPPSPPSTEVATSCVQLTPMGSVLAAIRSDIETTNATLQYLIDNVQLPR